MKKTGKIILLGTGVLIALGMRTMDFSKYVNSKKNHKRYGFKDDTYDDDLDDLDSFKNRQDEDEFLEFISCPAKVEIDDLREDVENNTEEIISLWEHIEALYKSKDNIDKSIIKKDRG